MVDNIVKSSFQKSPGLFLFLWMPLLALLGLLLIDIVLVPQAFMLPLLLLLVLGYLALRLPPWTVFVWGVVFAGVIFTILTLRLPEGHTDLFWRPYVRTGTFLIGGVAFTLLAGYRAGQEKSYQALLSVVTSLPITVVISDVSGNILFLNREAEKLLKDQLNNLAGLSYFSTFTSPGEQGRFIAKYIGYFDSNNFGPFPITLQTRGDSLKILKASISIFGSFNHLYAVTVIEKTSEGEAGQNDPGGAMTPGGEPLKT